VSGNLVGWVFGNVGQTHLYDPEWRPASFDGDLWESEIVAVPPSRGLILSWNAHTPDWSGIGFRISVQIDGVWTGWVPMGEWRQVFPIRHPDGPIHRDVDTATWSGIADAIRVRARLTPSHRDENPTLHRVIVATVPVSSDDTERPLDASDEPFDVNVSFRSQMDEDPRIAPRICGPTSLAMLLAIREPEVETRTIATHAYDAVHDVYGNWAHLAAVAGEHGYAAWVEQFHRLSDVEDGVRAGFGAIVSIAYEQGELAGSPIPRTNGHLVVLRGRTADGDVICNDPAFPDERGNGVVYRRGEFERLWAEHGGTTILMRPDTVKPT